MIAKAKPETRKMKRPTARERWLKQQEEARAAEQERRRQEWLAGVAERRTAALRLLTVLYDQARDLSTKAFIGTCDPVHSSSGYPGSLRTLHEQSPDGASDDVLVELPTVIRHQILALILAGDPATPQAPKKERCAGHWLPDEVPAMQVAPRAVAIDGRIWQALPGKDGGMVLHVTWDVPVERLD